MDIYLIAPAASVEETLALPDPVRYLSSLGRAQARALGERLRWHDCSPAAAWASPLVRAVQTAELIAAGLGYTGEVVACPDLGPGGNVHAIEAALAKLTTNASVILVGQEPEISGLGGVLVRRTEFHVIGAAEAVRICDGCVRWRFAHADEAPRPDPLFR